MWRRRDGVADGGSKQIPDGKWKSRKSSIGQPNSVQLGSIGISSGGSYQLSQRGIKFQLPFAATPLQDSKTGSVSGNVDEGEAARPSKSQPCASSVQPPAVQPSERQIKSSPPTQNVGLQCDINGKARRQPLRQRFRDAGIDANEPHLALTKKRRAFSQADLAGCIGSAALQKRAQETADLPTPANEPSANDVVKAKTTPHHARDPVASQPLAAASALSNGTRANPDEQNSPATEAEARSGATGPLGESRPEAEAQPAAEQQQEAITAAAPQRRETVDHTAEDLRADAARRIEEPSPPDHSSDNGGNGGRGDGPGGGGGGGGGSDDGGSFDDGDGEMDPKLLGLRRQRREDTEFREAIRKGMRECRSNLVTVALFSLVINILVLAIPVYLFQVSDRVLASRSTDTLIMLTIVVVGALAIYAMLDVVRRVILMRVAARIESILSAPVLKAATKSAQLGSTREFQTLQDLQQLRNFITGPVLLTMFDAPVAPLYFLVVYLIHPHLGIILTVAALVLVLVALLNQQLTAVLYSRANAFSQRANYQAEGMARNAQAVNAMGMVREGTWLWGREMAEALKSQIEAQDRNVLMTGVSKFLRMGTQVALLGWGAYLAIQGELTGGMMIAAAIIASRALAPIEGLIEGWRSYVGARSGYSRIMTLINSTPLATERLLLPRPTGRLQVERVLFVPPPTKKVVLNGLDFKLDPGESLAIVGPSGTGKSTLAKMLVGAIHPTSGSVRLDMMDIRNWDPRQFGECVGYLPQDVELFPGTIKSNIARLREDAPDELIFDAAELAGVTSMIADLPHGYETQIAIDGSPLSGGQRQRLGLARAFYGSPRLVVLDEPNSNLDTAGEQALASALKRAKERGISVVSVTQRPSLLKSVDKIMLMNEGRIHAFGAREEMLPRLAGPPRNNPPPAQSA